MHQWLFDVLLPSKNIKSASFEKHECNYRHYIKDREIGFINVQNATSLPFQRYYNDLYKNGIHLFNPTTKSKKHINVSSNKIFDLNKTLRAFFSYCVKEHYTLDNPCLLNKIEIPGNADGEEDETDEGDNIQIFDDQELEIIKNNLKYQKNKNNTFNIIIQLGFITGLRMGELLGLKKKFITEGLVKVRNTLKKAKIYDSPETYHRELKLIKPKSKTSIRNVNYPKNFYSILQLYFKEQEQKWGKKRFKI